MNRIVVFVFLSLLFVNAQAQELYFPPIGNSNWDTLSLEELSWCEEAYELAKEDLESIDTKAFIVLKDGKIVIEDYFNDFKQDSSTVWFSAAKSLMAFMFGLAQEEGSLSIEETSNKYLGSGWSSLSFEQEEAIKIKHHLKMTTGLDFNVENNSCTDPSCLEYLNPPDTHWYYHNAAYAITGTILKEATGLSLNAYTRTRLHNTIGMDGLWLNTDDFNLYFSTARSMARFGLLMLNNGDWDETPILFDKDYFSKMISPSQSLNPAYGYLWWLNGQSQFKLPESDFVFQGMIDENAPDDMYWAIGSQGQILGIIPSQNIVVVRLGGNNTGTLDAVQITRKITQYLNSITCDVTDNVAEQEALKEISIYPNPMIGNQLKISGLENDNYFYKIMNISGQNISSGWTSNGIVNNFTSGDGQYYILIYHRNELIGSQYFNRISLEK